MKIERTTLHRIEEHGSGETYQVELLHLVDGSHVAYRQVHDEHGGVTHIPARNGMAEDLADVQKWVAAL